MHQCLVCKKEADNIFGHVECLMVIRAFEMMSESLDKVAAE